MKRKTISYITLSVIAAIVVVVSLCANRWLTQIVCHELDQSIAKVDSMDIRYGDVRLLVLSGHVWINDVYLQTDTLYSQADSTRAVTRVEVGQLSIDGVNYIGWLLQKRIQIHGLTIKQPKVTTWIEMKDQQEMLMGDELREQMEAEKAKKQQEALRLARVFVEEAVIDRITIQDAGLTLAAINKPFRTSVESVSMEIYGIGYSFIDSIPYHYNDSVFHFDIRNVDIALPDGLTTLHSNGMTARPGGIIRIDTSWVNSRVTPQGKQYISARMDGLRIGGFNTQRFNQTKSLDVRSIHLDRPTAYVQMSIAPNDTKKEKKLTEDERRRIELRQQHTEQLQKQVMMFLTEVNIDTIRIHDLSGEFNSLSDHLYANADSLSIGVYGLGYSLLDSIPYHYNDSIYEFSLRGAHIITPDSLIEVINHGMHYTNGGALTIGRTRVHHIVDKWDLGPIKDYTPQAWIDLTMESLTTSQKNVVREALTLSNGFGLDTINVHISKMELHKDARWKPKKPYNIPQAAMLDVKYPFHIHRVNAQLDEMTVHVGMTKEAVGTLQMGPMKAQVNNVTAVPNETIRVNANGKFGGADVDIAMRLIVDRAGHWDMTLDGHDLDMHAMDDMVYPLVGMKIGCNIQHLHTEYGGDGQTATGTFCMEYSDLDVHADKESPSPIKVVANLSGLINSFAQTSLPHQNPYKPGMEPRAYHIKWKNDPWKEPVFFYIGPIIDGAVKTMLPGIFAIDKVKKDEPAK